MAYIFADGFDWAATVNDAITRWDGGGFQTLYAGANTAFGVGQAVGISTTGSMKNFGSNESTIFGTLRLKQIASGASQYSAFIFSDAGTAQFSITFDESTSNIYLRSGGATGTILATIGSFTLNNWDSYQFKAVVNGTAAGTFELRKNGSTTPLWSGTGLNLRAGTVNNYVNRLQVIASVAGGNHFVIDDLFLCSGSGGAPNDWPSDLRCVTNRPTATVQAQFSQSPAATTWGQATNNTTTTLGAGTIYFTPVTAPYNGTVSTLTGYLSVALTGSLNVALYADNGSGTAPVGLLAQGTTKVNPGVGSQAFTLGSPVTVTGGTKYWLAIWSSVSATSGALNGGSRATQSLTFTGTFPATASAGVLAGGLVPPFVMADLTGIPSHSLVTDNTADGDTSYVYSATVGQEDLYSFASLASQGFTPASIAGVIPFGVLRKSDSGARTVSIRAKSGATDAAALTNSGLGLSYSFQGTWLATDPNTGAAWTTVGVDALQVGLKVDA